MFGILLRERERNGEIKGNKTNKKKNKFYSGLERQWKMMRI